MTIKSTPSFKVTDRRSAVPFEISIVSKLATLLAAFNITMSSTASKSKTIESELETDKFDVSIVTSRTSDTLAVVSSTFIVILSAPEPVAPLMFIDVASGASIMNSSSPSVAAELTTTFNATEPPIDFDAILSIVTTDAVPVSPSLPSTPAREKVAPPAAFNVIVIAPVAVPENETTPPLSLTTNDAD